MTVRELKTRLETVPDDLELFIADDKAFDYRRLEDVSESLHTTPEALQVEESDGTEPVCVLWPEGV